MEAPAAQTQTQTQTRVLFPDYLLQQDVSMPLDKMHPLSPEIISRQATINIGTIGHVNHGKTTVVDAISNVKTQKFQMERESNITIKLGYANAKIFKCPECPRPICYTSGGSALPDDSACPNCGKPMKLLRHVSFVDCPGHDVLMATMISGAAVMDAALLLVAANETCPQPQTAEHLSAVEVINLHNIIIVQNKLDLVQDKVAIQQVNDIERFVKGTVAEGAPIIPVVAQHKLNIDVLLENIVKHFPVPERELSVPPRFIVIRSFDINKPGTKPADIKGGIAGGALVRGVFRLGEEIEVRPGLISKRRNPDGTVSDEQECRPIRSRIISMHAENNELAVAVPGGLVGIATLIDPCITAKDRIVGMIIGHPGKMPPIFSAVVVEHFLLKNVLGMNRQGPSGTNAGERNARRVKSIEVGECLQLNIGSHKCGGEIKAVWEEGEDDKTRKLFRAELRVPICCEVGEKVAISRRIENTYRLIGWGHIIDSPKNKQTHILSE